MRSIVFLAFAAFLAGLCALPQTALAQSVTRSCSAAPSGQGAGTICIASMSTGDGTNTRTFKYYVPPLTGLNRPLNFVLHRGTQNADSAMSESGYAWNHKADSKKLIVVFPEGKPDTAGSTDKNWNDCRAVWTTVGDGGMDPSDSSTSAWDDVTFFNNMLNWFQSGASLQPDMTEVYAMGPSNGGLMTQRLARESIASRFKGFGPGLAGLPVKDECPATFSYTPSSTATNVFLLTYGTEDQIMPPAGGCVAAPLVSSNCEKGRVQSQSTTISFFKTWLGINSLNGGTTTNITSTSSSDGDFGNNNLICSENSTQSETDYYTSPSVRRMRVVVVSGAGHTLPGTEQVGFLTKNTLKVGCRNLDRGVVDYMTSFWGL